MSRTNSTAVEIILGFNYATASAPSLTPYIDTASNIVDQLVSDASASGTNINSTTAELIERWLSSYFYCLMDPMYKSKGVDKARGEFLADINNYKKAAVALDPSGLLGTIMDGIVVSGTWGGKTDTEALDYEQRMGSDVF